MTEAQDKILKKWKAKEPRNKALAKSNYHSLCHSFFGEGVKLPEDYQYHYFVPEYSVNEKSSDLGEFNLGYVRRRRPTTEPEPSCSSHQQSSFQTYYPQPMQPTINPLLLDEGHPPHDWIIHQPAPDQDSAYGSGGTGEPVLPQNTNANMSYLQDPDWHLSTDPFSQDDLYARPLSITEDNWELGNYDEPSG
ncbi:hypothetical protein F5Y09DRAFT_79347 [Xylaria sp. FL1042]|nr:hypothetical protein F5Y09DRAFT_79347 [Xylaria sp. FL1042]